MDKRYYLVVFLGFSLNHRPKSSGPNMHRNRTGYTNKKLELSYYIIIKPIYIFFQFFMCPGHKLIIRCRVFLLALKASLCYFIHLWFNIDEFSFVFVDMKMCSITFSTARKSYLYVVSVFRVHCCQLLFVCHTFTNKCANSNNRFKSFPI